MTGVRGASFALMLAWLALTNSALGWAELGHRAIAEVARRRIAPSTRQSIVAILGNDDLAAVSNWADDVRAAARHEGPLADNAETRAFNARFPRNGNWHFVDLPLGTDTYRDLPAVTSADDIVRAIERCTASLETPSSRAEIPHREALEMLVHLVADLHQPLHVGVGYFRVDAAGRPSLVTDPASTATLPNDHGANGLFFGTQRLHPYWDVTLVEAIAGRDPARLTDVIAAAAPIAPTPGDDHLWARSWTSETLAVARAAYDGIQFVAARSDVHGLHIDIVLPQDYATRMRVATLTQLQRAAAHLAQLLDRLHWAP